MRTSDERNISKMRQYITVAIEAYRCMMYCNARHAGMRHMHRITSRTARAAGWKGAGHGRTRPMSNGHSDGMWA